MTVSARLAGAGRRTNRLAATILAALLIGCSRGGNPVTSGGASSANSGQAPTSSAPAGSPQGTSLPAGSLPAGSGPDNSRLDSSRPVNKSPVSSLPAGSASTAGLETKGVSATKPGNVRVQSVTPEEYKKIVAALKGKVVLVDFWATWCGPCREKFPQTLALAKKYASRGLTVISVSMDSPDPHDQEKVLAFLQQQNAQIINLANRMDDSEAAFGAFDIDGGALPHYKVFDRKGNPRRKFGGDPDHPFDEKDIERAVTAALEGK